MTEKHLGWIKLHRGLCEHWLWKDRPFSKGAAWVDMILMANHEPHRLKTRTGFVELERGSFHTEERSLAARWGWSGTKVRNFLTSLESEKMILKTVKKSSTGKSSEGTTVKVLNYGIYQDNMHDEKSAGESAQEAAEKRPRSSGEAKQECKNVRTQEVNIHYTEIQDLWNSHRREMPAIHEIDAKRRRAIKALWGKHPNLSWFQELFKMAAESDFLSGRVAGSSFVANFDWVLKNSTKILEKTYANRGAKPGYRPSEQNWAENEL